MINIIRPVDEIVAVILNHLAALPDTVCICTVSELMSGDEVRNTTLCKEVVVKLKELDVLCYYDPRDIEFKEGYRDASFRKVPIGVSSRRPSITVYCGEQPR